MHKIQLVSITFDDGSVGIMHFILDPNLEAGAQCEGYCPVKRQREATDAAIQAEVDKSTFAPRVAVSWRRIEEQDIPASRVFRNAWRDRDGRIEHCMSTCRKLHKDMMREHRAPLLSALDIEYQRADESGMQQEKKRVAHLKQMLRDITADPRIEAATTPEELLQVKLEG
jgi:hypothetical protein